MLVVVLDQSNAFLNWKDSIFRKKIYYATLPIPTLNVKYYYEGLSLIVPCSVHTVREVKVLPAWVLHATKSSEHMALPFGGVYLPVGQLQEGQLMSSGTKNLRRRNCFWRKSTFRDRIPESNFVIRYFDFACQKFQTQTVELKILNICDFSSERSTFENFLWMFKKARISINFGSAAYLNLPRVN